MLLEGFRHWSLYFLSGGHTVDLVVFLTLVQDLKLILVCWWLWALHMSRRVEASREM